MASHCCGFCCRSFNSLSSKFPG